MEVFVKDPHVYLNQLGVELSSAMDEERSAILDPGHHFRVNWETYFFADRLEKERFAENLLEFCDLVTDPVTRQRFHPNERSPQSVHDGVPYFFLSPESQNRFAAMPDSFSTPTHKMKKMVEAATGG